MGLAFCGAGQVLGLDGHSADEPIRPPKQIEKELEDVEFECKPCGEKISWEDGEEEEGREVKGQKMNAQQHSGEQISICCFLFVKVLYLLTL